jgi:hypothetical protein
MITITECAIYRRRTILKCYLLANYVQLVLMWQQMPEIQSQTKEIGTLQKKLFCFPYIFC